MYVCSQFNNMKEIPLGLSGKVALVDDEDYEYLTQRKWHLHNGYACMYKRGIRYRMHRILMDAKIGQIVDHIDRVKLNNQKYNLRIVTPVVSAQNTGPKKRTEAGSQYKGVYHSTGGNWVMVTDVGGIRQRGTYKTEIAAAHAYNKAVRSTSDVAYINDLSDTGMSDIQLDQLVIDMVCQVKRIKRSEYSSDIIWKPGNYMNGAWYPTIKTEDGRKIRLGAFEHEEYAIVAYQAVKDYIESTCAVIVKDIYGEFDKFEIQDNSRMDISHC